MIEAVIFDLYGTLLDLPVDTRPFAKIAKRGDQSQFRSAIRVALTTNHGTLEDFAKRIDQPRPADLPQLDAALQNDLDHVRLFPDAIPTLEKLRQKGLLTAVISNLATPYKRPFFALQLNSLFDVTLFSCDCGLVKPNPRIYQLALKQLGRRPSQTMMIGDSLQADVAGPSKLGIQVCTLYALPFHRRQVA